MTNLVIVDPGFGHTKASILKGGKTESIIFESIIARPPILVETGLSPRTPADIITFGDQPYLVGAFARNQSRYPQVTIDRARVLSVEGQALVLSALARLFGRSQDDLTLVISIPDAWHSDARPLRKSLTGTFDVKIGSPAKKRTFGIKQVVVRPQSLGAYISTCLGLGQGGRVVTRNQSILTGYTAVADIGYNTINLGSYAPYGDYRREYSDSFPLGVYGLIRRVGGRIHDEYRVQLPPSRIAAGFKGGKLDLAGESIDFKNGFVADLVDEQAQSIVSQMTSQWGAGRDHSTLIIASGGAGVFGEAIAQGYGHPNTLLPKSADQFQVSEGLLLWALKTLAEK